MRMTRCLGIGLVLVVCLLAVSATVQGQSFTDEELARLNAAAEEMEALGITGNNIDEAPIVADILARHGLTSMMGGLLPPPTTRKPGIDRDRNQVAAPCEFLQEEDNHLGGLESVLTGGGLLYSGASIWAATLPHAAKFVPVFGAAVAAHGGLVYLIKLRRNSIRVEMEQYQCD